MKLRSVLNHCFVSGFVVLFLSGWSFAFEPPRYEINASVDAVSKKVSAVQKVTFTNNTSKPVGELYFHIYPNRRYTQREKDFMLRYAGYFHVNPFPGGFQTAQFTLHSVKYSQKELPFTIEGDDRTILKIPLPRPLAPGSSVEVSLDFEVKIPHAYGRLGWHENIIALSRWYPLLSVLDETGWHNHPFYPFHRPFFSEAADYTVNVTVPSGYIAAHSGYTDEERVETEGTRTLTIKTTLPIREFSLALSPDFKVEEAVFGGIKVRSFYLPGNESHAEKALEDVRDLMAYYTEKFGKYPYKEFNIVPVYLGYGGEQMSNMMFIDTRVYQLPKILNRYFDFLVAHEAGHQWFYNVVGTDEYTEMWLEEGVNSYFILEYLENKYGPQAQILEWPKYIDWLIPSLSFRQTRDYGYKWIARTRIKQKVLEKLSNFQEPSTIFSLTYGKGAAILAMLREVMGQDAFERVFKRIYQEYSFKNLSIEEFIKLCGEESRKDLNSFFNEWLRTDEVCDYAVEGVKNNAIRVVNCGNIVMPVDIVVHFKNGKQKTLTWNGEGREEALAVDAPFAVKKIILDPKEILLDIDRSNNVWPRNIDVKIVPLYLPIYDNLPLFLKEDAYNVVIGPEAAEGGLGVKASFQKPYDYIFYGASGYEFNESLLHTRFGYQFNNLFHDQMTTGFELFNTEDFDGGEEDLAGGKAYIRKELSPGAYGLTSVNDHATFYLLRDRSLNKGASAIAGEDARNVSYLKKDDAIVGGALHFEKAGPYPDPLKGYKINTLLEHSGHFLGATQYFYRSATDLALYYPVTARSSLAVRFKYGWGYPTDKNLYELGCFYGLRGYDRKTLRGSNVLLSSLEYRFPIKQNLKISFFDHLLGIESVGGVVFADIGRNWYGDFDSSKVKKDAGLGLRITTNIASFIEKVVLRFDVAQAIDESKQDA